jgi:hypothetical protein
MFYADNPRNKSGGVMEGRHFPTKNQPTKKQNEKVYRSKFVDRSSNNRCSRWFACTSPLQEFSRKGKAEIYSVGEYLTGWETTKFDRGNVAMKSTQDLEVALVWKATSRIFLI